MSKESSFNEEYVDSLLQNEIIEDAERMSELDEIDSYLDSEAHVLLEQEMASEYELEHGSMDGYEEMLADRLEAGLGKEESSDLLMYSRIQDRINNVKSPELRDKLYARYAPEIIRGQTRSRELLARMERKIAKARKLDAQRAALRVKSKISLKPKVKSKEREHPGRVKEIGGGYPVN